MPSHYPRVLTFSGLSADTAPRAWTRELFRHWRPLPVLKHVGIFAFVGLFFAAYFHVLRMPHAHVTAMPLTPLDERVPFSALAFWPYVSLWVYVGIAPALMPQRRALLAFGAWAAALCGTGLLIFLLWPTAVPVSWRAPEVHAGFALMRGLDAAGNACPSLHVATAVFSGIWIHRVLRIVGAPAWPAAVNGAWLVLIVWSTVATRQHVVLDVVAGAALGVLFAVLSLRWGPRLGGPGQGQPV